MRLPNDPKDTLSRWLTVARSVEVLDRDEEVALVRRAKAGSRAAADKLVRHNLRMIVYDARRLWMPGVELDDVIQEASVGILVAIAKFDLGVNVRFMTYARW